MSAPDIHVVVAWPLARFDGRADERVPGAVVGYCERCRTPVSLAPSSQRVLDANPTTRVMCVRCGMDAVETEARAGRPQELQLAPGQLEEIRDAQRRRIARN